MDTEPTCESADAMELTLKISLPPHQGVSNGVPWHCLANESRNLCDAETIGWDYMEI